MPWPGAGLELLCTEAQAPQALCCRLPAGCSSSRGAHCKQRSVWASVFVLLQHLHLMLLRCSHVNILNTPPAVPVPESKGHLPPSPLSRTPWPWQPHYRWDSHPQAPLRFSECLRAPSQPPRPAAERCASLGPGKGDRGSPRERSLSFVLPLISRMQTPEHQPAPAPAALLVSGTSGNQVAPLPAAATALPAAPSPRSRAPIYNSELLKRRSSIPQEPTQLSHSL